MNILGQPLFFHAESNDKGFVLTEEESRHIVSSLRYKEGDTLFVTDGKGTVQKCAIVHAHTKRVEVRVLESKNVPKSESFRRMVVSPPKAGERLDWLVEKGVEIGVDEFVFVETRYSERDKLNLERLQKIAIAAMKQSKQVFLPTIKGMVKWRSFLEDDSKGVKLMAHLGAGTKPLKDELAPHLEQVTILIGPEGDFSAEEVQQAEAKGYVSVSLGSNVLRTETAVIYALVCLNSFK